MADVLSSALNVSPQAFLQPSSSLYTSTLASLKNTLDPLAADISTAQQQRQQDARKKRKRGQGDDAQEVLRLKRLHVEGFGVEQVWEQARRVIEAARAEAERGIAEAEERSRSYEANGGVTLMEDEDVEDDGEDGSIGEEGVDYEVEGIDDDSNAQDDDDDDEILEAGEEDGEDIEDEDAFDMTRDDFDSADDEPVQELVEDKFGLNDGFFSIDDFNKQSDFLEQQDYRGENDADNNDDDEEDVDWDADPLGQASANAGGDGGEGEDDDEEDGPTFGDPDAESEDDDDELDAGDLDDMGGMGNTNSVMYADFFVPPAQKKRKNKKGRPNPHNFPAATPAQSGQVDAEGDEEMERTMAAVQRDLFEDEDDDELDPEDGEELADDGANSADPLSRRSAHEKRRAALAEEIRKLEAANIAKREWTLQGEARATDRPINSLLEEDLEFERAGKPVPVITAEVSESIEELIKRRILAHEFQDIVRRRPDVLATGAGGKRGKLDYDLDNTKSKKGLAEEYEEEHLRRTDPAYVSAKDEKTSKEEADILALWNKVRGDLDSLSSWHFRPKTAAPAIEIRVDAPAISMEDARPTAGGDVAGASQLAPQEIYKGGESSEGNKREEVAGKSGLPAAREELSRDEKTRRRRREKERIRKAGGTEGTKGKDGVRVESKGTKRNKETLADLKRGGVKVIGKKGEVRDVEGNEARGEFGGGQNGGGRYRL